MTLEEQELFTHAEHLSSPPNFNCLCGVRVVCGVKLHVFTFLVLCCDVRCDFCVTRCSVRRFEGIRVLFMLYVFNYIYCCPPLFPYQMVVVSLKTAETSGTGTANSSSHFFVVLQRSVSVHFCLSIVFSVLYGF